MATLKQIEANRRNALKSTGPSTPEGKAAVRLNALRHGLRAHTVVLPGEKPEAFQQLCDDLEAESQPQTRTEQLYVEQMAVSQWKLRRMEIAEASLLVQKFGAKNQIPLLDRLWKAEARLERSFARAQHELERIQKGRPDQPATVVGQAVSPAEPHPTTTATTASIAPSTTSVVDFAGIGASDDNKIV